MQTKHATKRYIQIVGCFQQIKHPTLADIKKFVQRIPEVVAVSERTLKRDIEALRNDFGIEILYDFKKRHYFIDNQTGQEQLRQFVQLLQYADTQSVLHQASFDFYKYANYLYLDKNEPLLGVEHIQPLLQYILENKIVRVRYHAFSHEKEKIYDVEPYFLMQYQLRWYLLAKDCFSGTIRILALERFLNIQQMGQTFSRDPTFKPDTYFKYTFGITYSENKPECVHLAFHISEKKFLETLPLHESMKIVHSDSEYFEVQMEVTPNIELEMKLLSFGEKVRVIGPTSLKDKIKQRLENALRNY